MSTGMVICSTCRREVHQGRIEFGAPINGWYHCEDNTPRCDGATSNYPRSPFDVRGKFCCADGPLPKEPSDAAGR